MPHDSRRITIGPAVSDYRRLRSRQVGTARNFGRLWCSKQRARVEGTVYANQKLLPQGRFMSQLVRSLQNILLVSKVSFSLRLLYRLLELDALLAAVRHHLARQRDVRVRIRSILQFQVATSPLGLVLCADTMQQTLVVLILCTLGWSLGLTQVTAAARLKLLWSLQWLLLLMLNFILLGTLVAKLQSAIRHSSSRVRRFN